MTSIQRLSAVLCGLLFVVVGFSQTTPNFAPGVARWDIKTSVMPGALNKTPHKMQFVDLRGLAAPSAAMLKNDKKRMRTAGASGVQEGDIISTDAWVQLVAVEASKKKNGDRTDGDYHIQVSDARTNRDNVVIVEVPMPEFVSDSELKAKVSALRDMLKTKLHGGTEFSMASGSCIQHPVHMRLVGQLFYDATHSTTGDPGGGRGKQGHKAATLWELHPLYSATILGKSGPDIVPCK